MVMVFLETASNVIGEHIHNVHQRANEDYARIGCQDCRPLFVSLASLFNAAPVPL